MRCCTAACIGWRREGTRLRTETTKTAGARPVWGRVGTKTLCSKLVGLWTETSTSPLGRSSNRRSADFWNGQPSKRPNDMCLTTCVWALIITSPTCSGKFLVHPTVQLVAPFAPSILMRRWLLMGNPRDCTMSHRMMMICKPVSRMAGDLKLLLTRALSSSKGRQNSGERSSESGGSLEKLSCTVVQRRHEHESAMGTTLYSLVSTWHTFSFSAMFLQTAGLAVKT